MKFTSAEFNNVILFVWNRSQNEFNKMYSSIGLNGSAYAKDKYNIARTNFAGWWMSLDTYYQEKIIVYVKNYYEQYGK